MKISSFVISSILINNLLAIAYGVSCPAGAIMDTSGKYCCHPNCEFCGGETCSRGNGGDVACCTSKITTSCEVKGVPCIASENLSITCPTGGILDSFGTTCCPSSCGECGGYGCDNRPGGIESCCASSVKVPCSEGNLPCVVSPRDYPPPTSPCPRGTIPDSSGIKCCDESCGTCGGIGCHLRPGGDQACCTSNVTIYCNYGVLPCKVFTPSNRGDCPPGGITDDMGQYCCPSSCGLCGGAGCHLREGGDASCCKSQITASCRYGQLPCKISEVDPDGYCDEDTISATVGYSKCRTTACCPKSCPECSVQEGGCPGLAPECCAWNVFEESMIRDVTCAVREPPCLLPYVDHTECNDYPA